MTVRCNIALVEISGLLTRKQRSSVYGHDLLSLHSSDLLLHLLQCMSSGDASLQLPCIYAWGTQLQSNALKDVVWQLLLALCSDPRRGNACAREAALNDDGRMLENPAFCCRMAW